ncbi:SpaA isopeptide-forming pilin-related protein, partial [Enterococcus cecorum]|uniref:SpaA isopeptide-forming pilin-related protein n=1 Tax=Enterococcus cecorum TaxID=44008 RepID=UPI002009E2C2
TEVSFSKVEVNGSKELPGAELKVVKGDKSEGEVVEKWTSGSEVHKIKLQEGTYTMVETTAPKGYEVAESITFRVTKEGKVEVKEKDGNYVSRANSIVKMEDAKTPDKPVIPEEPKATD